jgi:hypothetical protein
MSIVDLYQKMQLRIAGSVSSLSIAPLKHLIALYSAQVHMIPSTGLPSLTSDEAICINIKGGANLVAQLPQMVLRIPLVDAASGCVPQFTNFTADFKSVLDYVFIDRGGTLSTIRCLPFPEESELAEHTGTACGRVRFSHPDVSI